MTSSIAVSTRTERIARVAREQAGKPLTSLAHHIDVEWLREAWRRTRKDGASGVDGVTASEYEAHLESNLQSLLDRAKSGRYHAPPVRRVRIPKGTGSETRPLGIPTLEDKVLQRAIVMCLEPVYEQDFLPCSYGFRSGRSAHEALGALWHGVMGLGRVWLVEVDIRRCFESLDHGHLHALLRQRVRDGVVLRLIGKWLNAGVMEDGQLSYPEAGTPQGGVISPLLANVYLHAVLDTWIQGTVAPRLRGRVQLIRYADDFVLLFGNETDARAVYEALPRRFAAYGLQLHPAKTRLVEFHRPPRGPGPRPPVSFDFLGFTHFWDRSRKGAWVVRRKTAKDRVSRVLATLRQWCRAHRHDPLRTQHEALSRRLEGHYGYYGITGNFRALAAIYREVCRIWHKWLSRRSWKGRVYWDHFNLVLERFPLPRPRIKHSYLRT